MQNFNMTNLYHMKPFCDSKLSRWFPVNSDRGLVCLHRLEVTSDAEDASKPPAVLHTSTRWKHTIAESTSKWHLFSELLRFWTLSNSGIIINWKTTFRKLDLFPSSGEETEAPTLLGLSGNANLNRWTTHVKVKFKDKLRPTDSQPVCLGVKHAYGTRDQFSSFKLSAQCFLHPSPRPPYDLPRRHVWLIFIFLEDLVLNYAYIQGDARLEVCLFRLCSLCHHHTDS
jgi:hypothetical protein